MSKRRRHGFSAFCHCSYDYRPHFTQKKYLKRGMEDFSGGQGMQSAGIGAASTSVYFNKSHFFPLFRRVYTLYVAIIIIGTEITITMLREFS